MIVGGAKPESSVSTWAPTAWPPCFSPLSSSRTMSSRASGSWHHTGQRGHHGRHAVAEVAALHVGAHAHRDHGLQLEAVGDLAAAAQVAAEGAGHGGQHHVVDRAAERVLDGLDVAQLGAHPGEAAVGPDGRVVGARRGRVEARPGHRAHAHRGIAKRRSAPAAARGTRPARSGPPRPAPWPARAAPRRAAWCRSGAGAAASARPRPAGPTGSGEASNSTETMSMPETPSTSAWWVLASRAKRSSSSPSTIQISQSGLSRSSCCEKTRPARSISWRSEPGAGSAVARTW